ITMTGRPIRYAVSIPTAAPNHAGAERFVAWLLSPAGRAVLRSEHLDALEAPHFTGSNIPHSVRFPE
ncbi:MAG: substrate-binding domain-containing protein, partial [Gemmatimonadaceae bacterium]